jgi:hypothetical protein
MRFRRSTVEPPLALLQLFALTSPAAEPGMTFIPGGESSRGRTHALPDDDLK